MAQHVPAREEAGQAGEDKYRKGKPIKYILNERQRRLLLERYDGRTETIDALLPHFPGVPRFQIKKWAAELGLARQKEPRWTEQELSYLERHIHRSRIRDIAVSLGRTETAVRLKAKRLDLRKTDEGYTMRGLCLGLGCDHRAVERWLSAGWLRGRRRHSDRSPAQGGDIWLFTDKAIRQFIKAHPNEIDPRRADWLWLVDVLVGGLGSLALPGAADAEVEGEDA